MQNITYLSPANEVGEDFQYDLKALRAPVLDGWKHTLFNACLRSVFCGALRTKLLKDSGLPQALSHTVIPEDPLFEREPFFLPVTEAHTTTIDPSADTSTRLSSAIDLIIGFKVDEASQSPPSNSRPTLRDYVHAYTQGICTPFDVARRIVRVLNDWGRSGQGLNWFSSWDEEDIINQGQASAQRYTAGKTLSLIDGVPFSVKDCVFALQHATSCGTGYLGNSGKDSEEADFITALKSMGAILIGKTNMHEIGLGVTGVNPILGTPINPWGEDRYPGGSSSGAGASTGAGLCPIAMGADGGGSIRIPSSFNGCVGLVPTVGRVTAAGIDHDYSVSACGPIAGCVEDAMVMYSLMADNGSAGGKVPPLVLPTLNKNSGPFPLEGLKMGLYSQWFNHSEHEVQGVCSKAVTHLENLGVKLMSIRIPDLELMRVAHTVTIVSEMANASQTAYDNNELMNGDTLGSLSFGRNLTAVDYVQSQKIRRRMALHFERVFEDIDFIVTPTTPITAPRINKKALKPPGETNVCLTSRIMRFMLPANFLGLPAITIPVGKDSKGLPIGFQIIGKHWQEATLLRAAYYLEQSVAADGVSCNDPGLLVNSLLEV